MSTAKRQNIALKNSFITGSTCYHQAQHSHRKYFPCWSIWMGFVWWMQFSWRFCQKNLRWSKPGWWICHCNCPQNCSQNYPQRNCTQNCLYQIIYRSWEKLMRTFHKNGSDILILGGLAIDCCIDAVICGVCKSLT